jgi:hypothetical protein
VTAAVKTPVADLDDPLGLAALEAELTWPTSGPLPSWLDGTDLGEFDDLSLPLPLPLPPSLPPLPSPPLSSPSAEPMTQQPEPVLESRVETLAEVGEKTEPRVDMAANGSENRPSSSMDELLDLVNLVSMYSTGMGPPVSAPPVPPAPTAEPETEFITPVNQPTLFGTSHVMESEPSGATSSSEPTANMRMSVGGVTSMPPSEPSIEMPTVDLPPAPRPRRVPSLDELAAARDCIVVEAGDRCWAVPLHAVVCLKPWPASLADIDVDLAEELGDLRPRPRNAKRWMLETTEVTFGVDGLRGPATIVWTLVEDADSLLNWMLAEADCRGETIGLIDLERWHRVEVIPDESEAPASHPTLLWSPQESG